MVFARRFKELVETKHGKSVALFGAREYALGYLRGESLHDDEKSAAMDGINNQSNSSSIGANASAVRRKTRMPPTNH